MQRRGLLGRRSHRSLGRRIHFAHPLNTPSLRAIAGLDLPILDYCTLHLGYHLSLERQVINHLRYYRSTHSLLVGFTTTALPLGGRRMARSSQPPLPL